MSRRAGIAGWGLVLGLLVSCGPVSQAPREVRPETDVCPECHMTVLGGSAAELVDADGQVLVFDDVGCLVVYLNDRPGAFPGAKLYVQDHSSQAWVPLESATFVRADAVPTPMNYGWHAFASAAEAGQFASLQPGSRVAPPPAADALAADLEPRRWKP